MSSPKVDHAVFVLTVEIPASTAQRAGRATFDEIAAAARLVRSHQMVATWGVAYGANLAQLAGALDIAAGGNELAWSTDAVWAGPNVNRGRFAVALAERATAALEADLPMSTMVNVAHELPPHYDVAAKYGIRSIVDKSRRATGATSASRPLRFGIWGVDVTATLSGGGSWWTSAARRAEKAIDRAVRTASACCVHADLSQLETLAVLDRVLAHVQRRRAEGGLRVETITQLTERLSRPRVAVRPAHSILRAA